jgi:CheY-like chemotaxis protein
VSGDRILFVDDEVSVLRGYQRILHGEFAVSTAVGGAEGLAAVQANGPYAVVISDMRMPGMDGAEFLARVREKAPNTVRMLLTGYADINSAIAAVNQGNIFRYLTKPCEKPQLVEAISSGLDLYHSIVAEKEMVKKAEMIGRTKDEWDAVDLCQSDDFQGSIGLPGAAEARRQLEGLFGADTQAFAILFKLSLLQTIEERYGEEAAQGYLKSAVQYLRHILRAEDNLFHWRRNVLMAVVRRGISPSALRQELTRLMSVPHQHLLDANGKKIMFAISATFDLLPVAQFASFEDLIEAFDAKLVAKI